MEIPGYVIEKQIGKGGMARVYLALHKALDRKVAIKVMNRDESEDSDFSERFMREARIVANLSHPNIVTIHDVGEHDGQFFIVMELLPSGETLSDKIDNGIDRKGALSIIKQVATALHVAHSKQIVHRDIKPDNIMFRADDSVVLMDFGIARSVDSEVTKMTQTGMIIGTPHYMSPEQAQGQEIGAYSDIYSLGVVFYEMLMGKVPYQADSAVSIAMKHISDPVPTLIEELKLFQPILDRMMAKTRKGRYVDCNHIIEDIDSIDLGKEATHATMILRTVIANGNTSEVEVAKTELYQVNKKSSAISGKLLTYVIGALGLLVAVIAFVFIGTDTEKLKSPAGVGAGADEAISSTPETPVELAKGKAILVVESDPSQAQVYLDGFLIGKTPFSGDTLPAGKHILKLSHENGIDEIDNLMLVDNEILKRDYKLKLAMGSVSLFSAPAGARIIIDGKDTGKKTPITIKQLTAGEHTLTLTKDAYYPKKVTINVSRDITTREEHTLDGGHLVKYKGKWIEPTEKKKRIATAKRKEQKFLERQRLKSQRPGVGKQGIARKQEFKQRKEQQRLTQQSKEQQSAEGKSTKPLSTEQQLEQLIELQRGRSKGRSDRDYFD